MSAEIRLRKFGPFVAAVLAVAVVARVWDIRAPLGMTMLGVPTFCLGITTFSGPGD